MNRLFLEEYIGLGSCYWEGFWRERDFSVYFCVIFEFFSILYEMNIF